MKIVNFDHQAQGVEAERTVLGIWIREAETRHNEIVAGKVVCRPIGEAVTDARSAVRIEPLH